MKTTGTKDQVWFGEAKRTKGGLRKRDLKVNKRGKVVSRAQSENAKRSEGFRTLRKLGYIQRRRR